MCNCKWKHIQYFSQQLSDLEQLSATKTHVGVNMSAQSPAHHTPHPTKSVLSLKVKISLKCTCSAASSFLMHVICNLIPQLEFITMEKPVWNICELTIIERNTLTKHFYSHILMLSSIADLILRVNASI